MLLLTFCSSLISSFLLLVEIVSPRFTFLSLYIEYMHLYCFNLILKFIQIDDEISRDRSDSSTHSTHKLRSSIFIFRTS